MEGGWVGGWREGVIQGKADLEEKSPKVSYMCSLSTAQHLSTLIYNYLSK